MLGYEELTEPERAVWNAIEAGALVELPIDAPTADDPAAGETWDEDHQIRAELLYELLTGVNGPKGARPHALKLAGARITGALRLEAATIVCPLNLRRCFFEQPLSLQEAQAPAVRLPGCRVPSLNGEQFQTRGNLDLNDGFAADGEVALNGAHIGGQLRFSGATLTNPDGCALAADRLTVNQAMIFGAGFTTQGEVSLRGAHIGAHLLFSGATLTNPEGIALHADGLTVDQAMLCRGGFTTEGEVRLIGAHIGMQLNLSGATLTNPEGIALHADGLTVDQAMLCREGFAAQGEVRLIGAHIASDLEFNGATLTNPQGAALSADGLTVDQAMYCHGGFTAQGEVRLLDARIGGQLVFNEATLTNSEGRALEAEGLDVHQGMLCSTGFTAQGEVHLLGAHIGGVLDFSDATLTNPEGIALDLEGIRTPSLFLRPAAPPEGTVDLTNAHVDRCVDSQATWPRELYLHGFTYEALVAQPEVDATSRLRWLERDPDGYTPQLYEQLAAAYRKAGRDDEARGVAIAKQRRRRQTLNRPGKLWNSLLRWTVGYGYQTWKAGVWLLILVGLGWWIFDRAHPAHLAAAKPPGQRPWFHAGLYALDLLLPFTDLGYQSAWIASGWARGFYLGWNLAGWVLITAVVAAISGMIKRD